MKISYKKKASGFTLIEMIGVLAVIAILAALLIPKIFEAINNARINNACISIGTVKSAIADHYAKHGSIAVDGSGATPVALAVPSDHYDRILLKEGFLDKYFATKIGDNTTNTTVRLSVALGDTAATINNAAYDLDGDTATTGQNDAQGGVVTHAVITGVTEADARELSLRLDGTPLSTAIGTDDLVGRVKYDAAASTTVYVYLTHR
jgi:prepilin-type N-terminal cleavage/methylation domain-containing protein